MELLIASLLSLPGEAYRGSQLQNERGDHLDGDVAVAGPNRAHRSNGFRVVQVTSLDKREDRSKTADSGHSLLPAHLEEGSVVGHACPSSLPRGDQA